jgi:ABC-2 type transport system permease protein
VADEALVRGDSSASLVDLRTTVRFNPTFDVKLFTVPAQVGFIVYQVTLTVASIGLARERELGTLEQLIVMPLTRLELVVGKALPALILGMVNFLSMLGVAVWGFGVPLRGSLWLLLALTLLFVLAEIGYGMFISGIAHTQQQAILLVFVLAMVDMAFSGFLVPIRNLPAGLRVVARAVPLRHYLTIMRSVMLRGVGLGAVWPHAAAMLIVGTLITGFAVRNLSRRLD